MHLGGFSFILQDYYVAEWADNLVFHVRVSDLRPWWARIVSRNSQPAMESRRQRLTRKAGDWLLA